MDNKKLKFYGDKYWDLINERYKTIIFIIQLLIALLVIASFSDKIIPISNLIYLKILIIFLLALTPIMMIDYLLKIDAGLNSLHQVMKFSIVNKKWYTKLVDGSNYIYVVITIMAIDIIIALINFKMFILIFIIHALFITSIYIFKKIKA